MATHRMRGWTPATIPFGLFVLLLGAWAFFVPLVGPYFGFGLFTEETWSFSALHWELLLGPGLLAFAGGLLMMTPAQAPSWLGGFLAAVAGMWLLVGTVVYPLWAERLEPAGAVEDWKFTLLWIGYFYGTGALITYFSGFAQGLVSRRGGVVVEEEHVEEVPSHEERERVVTRA